LIAGETGNFSFQEKLIHVYRGGRCGSGNMIHLGDVDHWNSFVKSSDYDGRVKGRGIVIREHKKLSISEIPPKVASVYLNKSVISSLCEWDC